MNDTIPTVWSADVAEPVVTPLAFLRVQATALGQMTRGLVTAEVTAMRGYGQMTAIRFDLYAAAIEVQRRIVVVTYDRSDVYPACVWADCFAAHPDQMLASTTRQADPELVNPLVGGEWGGKSAATYQEMIHAVREVFTSPPVRSAIQSMVARSSEIEQGEPVAAG